MHKLDFPQPTASSLGRGSRVNENLRAQWQPLGEREMEGEREEALTSQEQAEWSCWQSQVQLTSEPCPHSSLSLMGLSGRCLNLPQSK